jgi:hypothetical protein
MRERAFANVQLERERQIQAASPVRRSLLSRLLARFR